MPERVSVLHLVDCLQTGGTERQLFELLRRIDRRRFRPLLACFKAKGDLLERLRELSIEPFEFPLGGSLMHPRAAYQTARLALLCNLERVRILHAHDFYSNVVGVTAAQLAGARVIASRRDLGHWLNRLQRRALQLACRRADLVIANAGAVGEQVTQGEGVPWQKLRVVPNGIDTAIFDAHSARDPDPPLPPIEEGTWRIAMVASMHLPDKGHGDLLEAAALLRARGHKLQWLLISDGALRPTHEERAHALGLDEDVHFLGRRDDVASVLSRADLVVHPSWAEGFPNVILEAMCAARPVVATRVGGAPELVQRDSGILVEPRRPRELADAIETMLIGPEVAREMGRRGRAFVEGRYSLDRMASSVQDLYQQLLDEPAAQRAA